MMTTRAEYITQLRELDEQIRELTDRRRAIRLEWQEAELSAFLARNGDVLTTVNGWAYKGKTMRAARALIAYTGIDWKLTILGPLVRKDGSESPSIEGERVEFLKC